MILIKQQDAVDCGPSCLAMIAKHYGQQADKEQLREICSLGKDGVSLLGISKAAETIGFKTIGGRLSFDTLVHEVPLPCIAHWNQNHFVVVYKIKKHNKGKYTVYVADPGNGLVAYTKEEFCEHWISTKTNGEEKGIALLLEPIEQFYAQNSEEIIPTVPTAFGLKKQIFRLLCNIIKKNMLNFATQFVKLVIIKDLNNTDESNI